MQPTALSSAIALALTVPAIAVIPTESDAYEIDCAILLCLAGGFPNEGACIPAQAEFIRRITPWPIEPPVQIWNCPLGASMPSPLPHSPAERLYQAASKNEAAASQSGFIAALTAVLNQAGFEPQYPSRSSMLHLAGSYSAENGTADVDISDPTYDFVRSIRVFSVELIYQYEKENNQGETDCRKQSTVKLGSYGEQGDFNWRTSTVYELPAAFEGEEGYGDSSCDRIFTRAVFMEWNTYDGAYDFTQVNY